MKAEIDVLALLDEMDSFRRAQESKREVYPDYCMRVLEAMVAKAAGYTSRADWTEALERNPDSAYSKDLLNYGVAFRG